VPATGQLGTALGTARGRMARITIEDCIRQVPNRFHLVQIAAIRTKQLKKGARALVDSEDNKEIVVALREIAAGYVKPNTPPVQDADED
jgi:DNA-directed RNA polymerase omega subunit